MKSLIKKSFVIFLMGVATVGAIEHVPPQKLISKGGLGEWTGKEPDAAAKLIAVKAQLVDHPEAGRAINFFDANGTLILGIRNYEGPPGILDSPARAKASEFIDVSQIDRLEPPPKKPASKASCLLM